MKQITQSYKQKASTVYSWYKKKEVEEEKQISVKTSFATETLTSLN